MKGSRVLAVTRKTLSSLRHDPRTVALMLIAPIMAMLIFGFAFGSETKHVPVIVVNEDQGTLAADLVARLDHDKLDLRNATDLAAARDDAREGRAVAVLHFPANFTADATPTAGGPGTPGSPPLTPGTAPTPPQPAKGARVEVFLDTTNNALSSVVVREMADAAQKLAASKGIRAPIATDVAYAHPEAKDARFIDSFVPGIMAFAVTLFTTLLTLLAFVGERTTGTMDRLRVTPATEAEIVLGYELAFGLIAAVQGALLLAVAILLYHVLVVGPLAVAVLLVILTAIDAQAIGILISAAAQREGQAVQMIPFIILPVFLLSGIFVPVESLPGWLKPLSYLLPPTWAIQGLRDVMLRGWGLEHVWLHVAVLSGFAIVFTALAILGLRRSRAA
jgi:ABC-2 type transport system permease protein